MLSKISCCSIDCVPKLVLLLAPVVPKLVAALFLTLESVSAVFEMGLDVLDTVLVMLAVLVMCEAVLVMFEAVLVMFEAVLAVTVLFCSPIELCTFFKMVECSSKLINSLKLSFA